MLGFELRCIHEVTVTHARVMQMRVVDQVCHDPGCACSSTGMTAALCCSVFLRLSLDRFVTVHAETCTFCFDF